jgi:hypothetical protein
MQTDENDEFDESVDPYDRSMDFEYDDGIEEKSSDDFDEQEESDDSDWDVSWDDDLDAGPA